MNKNFMITAAALSLAMMLTSCNEEKKVSESPAASVQPSIAVIKLANVYQDSRIGKMGMNRVNEVQKKATAEFEQLQSKLEKARSDKKDEEAANLEKEMQGLAYFLQNVIKQDQEHVMNVVQTALKKAMDGYRSEKKLVGIVPSDTMLSYDPKADVTAEIVAILEKDTSDFGPLPSLEMPKIPDPGNAEAAAKLLEDVSSSGTVEKSSSK